MPGITTVNGSTSVVLVDTSVLTSNASTYVVLLSSTQTPGRAVTIRDSIGYLSTPNSIVVSTTAGVRFLDGTTKAEIKGAYGYLTVTSFSPTLWAQTNSFGFPVEQTAASFRSLTASTVTTQNIYASGFLSTGTIESKAAVVTSSFYSYGPTAVSTLIAGSLPTDPFAISTLAQGYTLGVRGSARISSSLSVGSNLSVGGAISTGSNLFVGGNISTLGSFSLGGSLTVGGAVSIPNGALYASTLSTTGFVDIGDSLTVENAVRIGSSLSVHTSISSLQYYTSSLYVTSSIQMQGKSIIYRTNDLLFTSGLFTPSISTNAVTVASNITTSSLSVTSYIDATTASFLYMSSTQIVNPSGSLSVSSILANSLTLSNTLIVPQVTTSSFEASTLAISGNLSLTGTGYLSMHTGIFSTVNTDAVFTKEAFTTRFITSNITISTLSVYSQINAPLMSTFNAQRAFINNSEGSIVTSSLQARFMTISSLLLQSGLLNTTSSTFTISTPSVYFDALTLSSLTVSSATTAAVTTKQIYMGSITDSTAPIGAYWQPTSNLSPINMSTYSGKGDFFSPLTLSNVAPVGILPGQSYPVRIDLSVTIPTPTGEFLGNTGVGTSYFKWANEPNSFLYFVYNFASTGSNIVGSQLGLNGSNQTTSFTVPAQSQNIYLPNSGNLTIYGELVGNATVNIVFGNSSNALVTYSNPSTLIQMNNGRIAWNYAFNTTTIENSLNDISTRNLYYFGTLNYTSDPKIKENIRDADLDQCHATIDRLPLYTYNMKPEYCSTFGTSAARRIGVLANQLEEILPNSVKEVTVNGATFKTVDAQQLDMAHLGATKRLIQDIKALKLQVSSLFTNNR